MQFPVQPRLPRRQAFLFLIAILVPCLVLIALGLRMIDQERQLEDKRRSDERRLAVVQLRQDLLSLLEKTKLQEAQRVIAGGAEDSRRERDEAVVLAGTLADGRLQLPWENDSGIQRFREQVNEASFASAIRQAEAEELVEHQYPSAVRRYRAVASARQPVQQTYARLLLARVLAKWGRRAESAMEYERVLASDLDLVDEHGVPLALYAAPPLLDAGAGSEQILERIRLALITESRFAPAALYLARDLARKMNAQELEVRLAVLIHDSEQAEALQRDSARLAALAESREPVWIVYGDPPWLVSATAVSTVSTQKGLVVAVRAGEVLARVSSPARPIRVAAATETAGDALGESFPGLRVMLPAPEEQSGSSRQTFLGAALFLALAFTLLAGYLLWRDVKRDLRLAELRSQFVSSVTHELKTPLTAIRMFTETLRLDEEVDQQTRAEYLDTILHESERLSRLVDNVLDFGKIERGKKIYHLKPVRLEEVVEGAARAIQYPLQQAGFALDVAVERDLPPLDADSDALQQAILNLLTNAMKYSGGSRRIRLGLERKNGDARIQVADQGIGIAPEERGRIFERFYRAPISENQHIPGTGLGLTLVAHIAKAHGGNIEIESSPGTGSTFTIRLPLPDVPDTGSRV